MPQIEKPDQICNQSQIWSGFLYARQSPSIMETAEKSPAAKLNENLARWFSGLCIWQNQNVYASLRTIPIFGLSHGFPILETFRIQSCQMPIKKNGHFNASVSLVQNVQVKDSLRYNGRGSVDLRMKKKFRSDFSERFHYIIWYLKGQAVNDNKSPSLDHCTHFTN